MARKTAIHVTNAQQAAAEYRLDAVRDRTQSDRQPSALDIIRAARDIMSAGELLAIAKSAARLELRGANYDAEDRADCAAEITWHILAEGNGCPPRRNSDHATLTYACGLASNWRRALLRRRAATERARQAAEDAFTMSAAVYDAADALTYSPAYAAAAAEQTSAAAHRIATEVVRRLTLPAGGAVYASIYQWARHATAEVCAAELCLGLSAFKMRATRGAAMIRAIFPDPTDLLDALTDGTAVARADGLVYSTEDASRAAQTSSPGWNEARLQWQTAREGTDEGNRAARPENAADARAACLMRHQCPTPGLAEIGRARLRRGYIVAAPNVAGGFYRVPGRSAQQQRADALRALARDAARRATRERSISPVRVAPMSA